MPTIEEIPDEDQTSKQLPDVPATAKIESAPQAQEKRASDGGPSTRPAPSASVAQERSVYREAARGVLLALGVALMGYVGNELFNRYVVPASPDNFAPRAASTPGGSSSAGAQTTRALPVWMPKKPAAKKQQEDLQQPDGQAAWGPEFVPLGSTFSPRAPQNAPVTLPNWAQHSSVAETQWPKTPKTGKGGKMSIGGLKADVKKREAIKEAFVLSWGAYERDAFGSDEYWPLARTGSNLTRGAKLGVGATVVDAMDTMLLMGLEHEFSRAAKWVRDELDFAQAEGPVSTFEMTARVLGGLLSAHHMAPPAYASTFLSQARQLGDRLLAAFDSPSGIPWSLVDLAARKGVPDVDNHGLASISEAAGVQLELRELSRLTGDGRYWRAAEKVMEVLRKQSPPQGVMPIFIQPSDGRLVPITIRLGSRGDGYYEYLLKQWLQTDRTETVYRDMYDAAMDGIRGMLIDRTPRQALLFTRELEPRRGEDGQTQWRSTSKQDHLVCSLAGNFLLGLTDGARRFLDWSDLPEVGDRDKLDYLAGSGLLDGCLATHDTATGLAPEIAIFLDKDAIELVTKSEKYDPNDPIMQRDWYIKGVTTEEGSFDARNLLRPETVESLLIAYRLTGHQKYRDAGWRIFLAFARHCQIPGGGYAPVSNVEKLPPVWLDKMDSYWLSETLKYLYLLFDDDSKLPLDQFVLTTKGHALPVFRPHALTNFGRA